MIIEKVTPLLVKTPRDVWAWVRITTDTGLQGWGEFSGNPISNQAVSAIIRVMEQNMAGKGPLDPERCLAPIRDWRYPSFLDSRYAVMALSALDMALWDLRAKWEGVPLRELLFPGVEKQTQIPLYANLNRLLRGDRSEDSLKAAAQGAMKAGFGMAKIAPFDEVTPLTEDPEIGKGIRRLRLAEGETGPGHIALDCHCRFTVKTFLLLLEQLKDELNTILFLEDPVRIHRGEDLRPVWESRPEVIYGTGEDCFYHEELLDLAESGYVSILNPDLKYIGGVSGARELFPLLRSRRIRLSIHNPSGPVATAYSAQAAACYVNDPIEFAWGGGVSRDAAWGGKEPVEEGRYLLLDRPGMGFEPAPAFLEEYARPVK